MINHNLVPVQLESQSIVLLAKADTSICLIMVGPFAEVCTRVYQQQCERLL